MRHDPEVLEALHSDLQQKLSAFTSGEEWLRWIGDAHRFHRYSARNQMLLAIQGARGNVASYRAWQGIPAVDGGHCQVRRGEKGLTILAPMTVTHREVDESTGDETVVGRSIRGFRAVKVFHQEQLVAPPDLADPPLPELLTGPDRWNHVWTAVVAQLQHDGFTISLPEAEPSETWNGRTQFTERAVEVMEHLEPPQRIKTLLHEWAHVALGHGDQIQHTSRELREVEAESVAYLLCSTIGLDSSDYTIPYLAGWSGGDGEVAERTARHVLTTTAKMVEQLETRMNVDLTPDQLSLASDPAPATTIEIRSGEAPAVHDARAGAPSMNVATTSVAPAGSVPASLDATLDRLSSSDGQLLLTALANVDDPGWLATAAGLCADAGISAAEALDILGNAGADELGMRRAVTQTVTTDDGDQVPMFEGSHGALQKARSASALDVLTEVDKSWLNSLDLKDPVSATYAVHHLSDKRGLDADQVEAIASHLGIDPIHLDNGYSPDEPAAESSAPRVPAGDAEPEPVAPAGRHDQLLRETLDAGRDPKRIAALATGLGMQPEETIAALGRLGLDPELAVAVALARREGDIELARGDLESGWTAPAPTDGWSAHLPEARPIPNSPKPAGRRSVAAHAIVDQWMAMSPSAHSSPGMR